MIKIELTLRQVKETYDTHGRLSTIVVTVGRKHRSTHTIGFDFGYDDSLFLGAGEIHKRYHDTPDHLPVAEDAVHLAKQVRAFAREIAEQRREGDGIESTTTTIEISRRLASSEEIQDAEDVESRED